MFIDKQVMAKMHQDWQDDIKSRYEAIPYEHMSSMKSIHIISDNHDVPSMIYIKNKINKAREIGIPIDYSWKTEFNRWEIAELFNKNVSYPMLQLPTEHMNYNAYLDRLYFSNDVDGALAGNPYVIPPVANGVRYFLQHYDADTAKVSIFNGMNAVVIGRSEWTGLPITNMLIKDFNLNVTQLNSFTLKEELDDFIKTAKLIVTCAGVPDLLNKDNLFFTKEHGNKLVIDVGINKVNGKMQGDVNPNLVNVEGVYVTPVPGGMGPFTVLGLLDNYVTLEAHRISREDI